MSPSKTLLIDVGNTAIKWQFNNVVHSVLAKDFELDLLPEAQSVFVSCVGDCDLLKALDNATFVKSSAQFVEFKSSYQVPTDLGVDRFLAMIGAIKRYPQQNLLIIDAGSALTFDLVFKNGEHQGGLIMPGLGVMRKSFQQFSTESLQLPLKPLADNTQDAWAFGTAQMLMSAINTQINQHLESIGDLLIVLTGGNAKIIALKIEHPIELCQDLVLEGLAKYAQTHSA